MVRDGTGVVIRFHDLRKKPGQAQTLASHALTGMLPGRSSCALVRGTAQPVKTKRQIAVCLAPVPLPAFFGALGVGQRISFFKQRGQAAGQWAMPVLRALQEHARRSWFKRQSGHAKPEICRFSGRGKGPQKLKALSGDGKVRQRRSIKPGHG